MDGDGGNDSGNDSGADSGAGGLDAGGFGGQGFGDSNTGGFTDGGYSADSAGGYGDAAGLGDSADTGIGTASLTGYSSAFGFNAAKDSQAASAALGLSAADVSGFTGTVDLGNPSLPGAPAPAPAKTFTSKDALTVGKALLGMAYGGPTGVVAGGMTLGSMAMDFAGSPAPNAGFAGGAPGTHSGTNSLGGGFADAGGFGGGADPAPPGGYASFGYSPAASRSAGPATFGAPPLQLSSSYGRSLGAGNGVGVGVGPRGPNSRFGASPTPSSGNSGMPWLALAAVAAAAFM